MKKILISFSIAVFTLLLSGASIAQSMAAKDDQLYKAFGEKAGLVALMDDFMVHLLADARTGPHFKPSNQQRVKEKWLTSFAHTVAGLACTKART